MSNNSDSHPILTQFARLPDVHLGCTPDGHSYARRPLGASTAGSSTGPRRTRSRNGGLIAQIGEQRSTAEDRLLTIDGRHDALMPRRAGKRGEPIVVG